MQTNWRKIDYVHQPTFEVTERKQSTSIPEEKLNNPFDIFTQFFDDEFFAAVAEQTNLYANQVKHKNEEYLKIHPRARLNDFQYVTIEDIRTYMAMVLLMGVHSLPSLRGRIL